MADPILPDPIKDVLTEELEESVVQAMWIDVRARALGPKFVWRGSFTWMMYGAGTVMLALSISWLWWPPPEPPPSIIAPSIVTRLLVEDGSELGDILAGSIVRLADRSSVEVARDTELVTLTNEPDRVSFLLRKGRVSFDVERGEFRRWMIECGHASVEVVESQFVIERDGDLVRINVDDGVVLVRSEQLPDRVVRLVAGQAVSLRATKEASPDAGARAGSEPAIETKVEADAKAEVVARPKPRKIARAPVVAGASTIDAALERADVLRAAGEYELAVEQLERALELHSAQPNAAIAAFTLGRLRLERLAQPASAALAFARALELNLPGVLHEDCLAHLATAYARSGQGELSSSIAAQYLERYPEGYRADEMKQLLR